MLSSNVRDRFGGEIVRDIKEKTKVEKTFLDSVLYVLRVATHGEKAKLN